MAGVLQGVRIVELAALGPAPFCCALLADMGAEILTVRPPGRPPPQLARLPDPVWRGRHWVELDLKDDDGRASLLEILSHTQLLVEGFRPGVLERLGLDPARLLDMFPKLVIGRMTGWGQDGPLARTAGHDANFIAIAGALGAIGNADAPVLPLNLVGDFGGGALYLATGLLAALRHAERTGEGQVVDAAIVDGVGSMMGMMHYLRSSGDWLDERGRNVIDGGAPHATSYRTLDDRHIVVGAAEDKFYRAFLTTIGLDAKTVPDRADRANWPALKTLIAQRIETRSRDEWMHLFADVDACVSPVLDLGEAVAHPHAKARSAYAQRDGVVVPAPAPRFSRTGSSLAKNGENGAELLRRWRRPSPRM